MLERGALARMLQQFRAEQAEAEAELAVLQRRVNSLRQAAAGIEGLLDAETVVVVDTSEEATAVDEAVSELKASGELTSASAPSLDRPRGAEAIRRVFADTEGTGWTVREMTDELERRGWTPDSKEPIDAVRTAMTRIWRAPNSGIIREGSKFIYRPSRNGNSPSAREETSNNQEADSAAHLPDV